MSKEDLCLFCWCPVVKVLKRLLGQQQWQHCGSGVIAALLCCSQEYRNNRWEYWVEKHSQEPVTYLSVVRRIFSSRCNTHLYICRMTVNLVSEQTHRYSSTTEVHQINSGVVRERADLQWKKEMDFTLSSNRLKSVLFIMYSLIYQSLIQSKCKQLPRLL